MEILEGCKDGIQVDVKDYSKDTLSVSFWYPTSEVRNPPQIKKVRVGLTHVRAADEIEIEFDFPRDGYVIRMDKTKEIEGGGLMEIIEENVEVGFIPAWFEEE